MSTYTVRNVDRQVWAKFSYGARRQGMTLAQYLEAIVRWHQFTAALTGDDGEGAIVTAGEALNTLTAELARLGLQDTEN